MTGIRPGKSNRKLYMGITLFLVIILIITFTFLRRSGVSGRSIIKQGHEESVIGVYDRSGKSERLPFEDMRHISLVLNKDFDETELDSVFSVLKKDAPVLFTLETAGSEGWTMLPEFIAGKYDNAVNQLCQALVDQSINAFLRWNPEMEVPAQVYPWQNQAGDMYINAFRHFTKLVRQVSPDIQVVWGPSGFPGVEDYWPGEDAVDFVSITVESKSEQAKSDYPKPESRQSEITRKLYRMRFMRKPVLVLDKKDNSSADADALAKSVAYLKNQDSIIYSFIGENRIGAPVIHKAAPVIGVYDPKLHIAKLPNVQVEHLFIDLGNINDGTFKRSFDEIINRNHDVILTVEPWRDNKHVDSTSLSNTINGLYDAEFRKLYKVLKSAKRNVYLRFAHEMEIPIHRYAWQSQDPILYIKAFRYFMNFDAEKSGYIKKVWGPAGDRGSMEFWPGDDVVDFVSLAIYGLPDKNITDHNKQELFSTIYQRKFHRVRMAQKPIFITEFGVTGPADFQLKWLENASETVSQHGEIFGMCYFNLEDNPKVWGNIPTPVWSISPEAFNHFVKAINRGK
jgi:beta-mannanase